MKKYVVGFVFDSSREHILLIHKNRPEWQKGFINGLGGKIEDGETALSAMVREIQEESGLLTLEDEWVYVGRIYSDTMNVEFFGYEYRGDTDDAQSLEDEPIEWFPVKALPINLIENLTWLIPITLDKLKNKKVDYFDVKCQDLP